MPLKKSRKTIRAIPIASTTEWQSIRPLQPIDPPPPREFTSMNLDAMRRALETSETPRTIPQESRGPQITWEEPEPEPMSLEELIEETKPPYDWTEHGSQTMFALNKEREGFDHGFNDFECGNGYRDQAYWYGSADLNKLEEPQRTLRISWMKGYTNGYETAQKNQNKKTNKLTPLPLP